MSRDAGRAPVNRRALLWLLVIAILAVVVAAQTVGDSRDRAAMFAARADAPTMPTVAPGTDVLDGIAVLPQRVYVSDYRRAAFGESWTDDNDAPGGHNGCDTRNDILDRDLVDKTYTHIRSCPTAVATGVLHDPYTNSVIDFTRGAKVGQSVQIDHLVPLAYAWGIGARDWTDAQRVRFANDPANLLAVQGKANQDKGASPPADWMPPNHAFWCQYSMQFIAVLRGYGLPVDARSAQVLRDAATTCPTG